MDQSGYILLSRMTAQLRATEALANNLANANTPGFQAQRMLFGERLAQQRGIANAPGAAPVAYAIDRATWRDTAAGPVQTTGNPLDVAIQGEGFFVVESPGGERFTRAGHFALGSDGRLQDMQGHAVLGAAGTPISFAANDTRIEILGDGTIRSENGVVGRLRIVRFENPQQLTAEGDRLFNASAPPEDIARPTLVQGAVEGSNISPVQELTRLTTAQRLFEFAAQFSQKEAARSDGAFSRILGRAA